MCLFDPQAYTYVLYNANPQSHSNLKLCLLSSNRNTIRPDQCNVYWDGGLAKIEAFREQHALMCEDNWVCNRLSLRQTIVEDASDTDTEPSITPMSSPKKPIDKQSVNYLVNP